MISKRSPNRTKINITSQTAVSVYIRMFSDRFASLFHLSVLRKKLQIPRKGHQIRGCRFFSSSSQLRATFEKKRAKKQPNSAETSTPKPSKKVLISTPPPRTPPKSLQNSKKPLPGVPGVSPEGPRATVERPREVPGAPPERPRSAQITPEASKVRPRCLRGALWTPFWLHLDLKMEVWEPIWPQKGAQIPTPRPPPRFQHPVLHRGGPCERREIEKGSAGIAKRTDARAQTHGGTRHYTSAQGRFPFLPLQVM